VADTIAAKITVDVVELQAKAAIARQELAGIASEMRQTAQAGRDIGLSASANPQLLALAEKAVVAKANLAAMNAEIRRVTEAGNNSVFSIGGLQSAFGGLKTILGTVGITLAATELLHLGQAAEESAAQIEHESKVLQLSSTDYQVFRESARLAGVDVELVDTALKRFMANAGAAQQGNEVIRKAFRDLGIDANTVGAKDLPAVSRALLALGNDSRAAKDEVLIFSRSGEELNPVLTQWGRGTADLNKELNDLGVLYSPKATEEAERTELALKKAGDTIDVLVQPAMLGLDRTLLKIAASFGLVKLKWEELGEVDPDAKWAATTGHLNDATRAATAAADAHKHLIDDALVAAQDEDKYAGQIDLVNTRLDKMKAGLAAIKAEKTPSAEDINQMHQFEQGIGQATRELERLRKEQAGIKGIGGGFANAGEKLIAETREQVTEINAIEDQGNVARLQKDQQAWAAILNNAKLNMAQKLQVQEEYNRATRELEQARVKEDDAIAKNEVETTLRISQLKLQAKRDELAAEFQNHEISAEEYRRIEQELLDEEFLQNRKAIEDAQKKFGVLSAEYRKYLNDLRVLDAQYDAAKEANDRKYEANYQAELRQQIQATRSAYSQMTSVADSFFNNVASGNMTVLRAAETALGDFLQKEIETDIKGWLAHLFYSQAELNADKSLGQMGLLYHLLFEDQKTAATAAGATERVAVQQAASAEGMAADAATGSAQIMNDAYKAAAGAYNAVVGIPIVGPILAPIAAGVAFGAVAAFDTLTSAEGGDYNTPGGFYQLHKQEAVMPASVANPMRDFFKGQIFNRDAGQPGHELHWHYSPNITHNAPVTLDHLLAREGRTMLTWVAARWRDGSMKKAMA